MTTLALRRRSTAPLALLLGLLALEEQAFVDWLMDEAEDHGEQQRLAREWRSLFRQGPKEGG